MKAAKIKVLIVDDESLARMFIRGLLETSHDFEVVGECDNGKDAVALVKKERPDIVFLDVQMPEMDGFGVLQAIGKDRLPEIIFTTAYEEYAIRAFELHALDYLLKPFDEGRFQDAIQHAKQRFQDRNEEGRVQIGALLDSLREAPEYLERLIVRADGRITFLRTREIDWIEADDKYVHLHTGKTALMLRQTISAIEAQLNPRRFVRIHRSAIVNVARIKDVRTVIGGDHSVTLEDGTKLTLSRTYKDKLFSVVGNPL